MKENRSACPAALTVVVEPLPTSPVALSVQGSGFEWSQSLERDTTLLLRVPTSGVLVQAVAGAVPEADGSVRIPQGFDCPPLYLFARSVDTSRDTATVKVLLHKHFCTLTLRCEGPPGWGEPYWATIRGGTAGVSPAGAPIPGDFACRLDTGLRCRLPRQPPDDALWLEVVMPDRVVRHFALHTYLQESGYDWTTPDLADLQLTLSLSVTEMVLHIGLWSTVIPLSIDV